MPDLTDSLTDDFSEFPSVSPEQWAQKATETVQPAKTSLEHPEVIFSLINTADQLPPMASRGPLPWASHPVQVEVKPNGPLNPTTAQTLVQSGVSALCLSGRHLTATLATLRAMDTFPGVSLEVVQNDPTTWADYLAYFREANKTTRGTLYHPSTRWATWVAGQESPDALAELVRETQDLPTVRVIAINGDAFHRRGASTVDELAMTLSWLAAYSDELSERGVSPDTLLARTEITLATGSDFYLDLAKFRALRVLVDKVAEAHGLASDSYSFPLFRAVSGTRNKTLYDPDSNILRNTTEGLAALLGGVDTVSLLPHDFLYSTSAEFGQRMATNVYNILRHEAHVTAVADPAAGSYFLEDITRQLVEKGWQLFLDFEAQGGFAQLLRNGIIEERCERYAKAQIEQVNQQKKIVVGANRYANGREEVAVAYDSSVERWAASFEELRQRMDQRVARGEPRLRLQLWVQRDASSAALINQRAHYVKDLLAAVGLSYEEHAIQHSEDFVPTSADLHLVGYIFCGTNAFYTTTVVPILANSPEDKRARWIVGGDTSTAQTVRQAGGNGVLAIGQEVVFLLKQQINRIEYEA